VESQVITLDFEKFDLVYTDVKPKYDLANSYKSIKLAHVD